jgi:hypothetical protein
MTEGPVAAAQAPPPAPDWPLFPLEGSDVGAGRSVACASRDVPVEIRLLKLTEEVGEAAEALIGMQGLFSELPK